MIGLIAAVTVEILETSVVDVYTALLAIGAFLALNRWHGKLTVLYVVLGCGAIGALLQATVRLSKPLLSMQSSGSDVSAGAALWRASSSSRSSSARQAGRSGGAGVFVQPNPWSPGRKDRCAQQCAVIKRTLVSFYDDQMTQHAAALTYYSLMSLFPAMLLGLSLLGLLGQYPSTYNAIINYLRDVVPHSALVPLDSSLRQALQHKGSAVTAFAISIALTLYGTTGVLEAARRALNVVFELEGGGRSFLRRKSTDIVFTFVLMGLVLASLIMLFIGGRFAADLFGFIGLGPTAASIWSVARWPGALAITMLIFALIYYVTPDVKQRAFRWVTPGAFVGVLIWLAASVGFSAYISQVANVGALYGAFAGAIVLVAWLWLTNVALLFGAELDAEIERQKELGEGVPERETLNLPTRAR